MILIICVFFLCFFIHTKIGNHFGVFLVYVYLANFIKFSPKKKISKICCITQLVFSCRAGGEVLVRVCSLEGRRGTRGCSQNSKRTHEYRPNFSLGRTTLILFPFASFPFHRKEEIFPWEREEPCLFSNYRDLLGSKLCYYYYYY